MTLSSLFENNSFSANYTSAVREIAQILFSNTNIIYFIYMRGTKDGLISVLLSDAEFFRDSLERSFAPTVGYMQKYKALQNYSFFWEEKLPATLISLARKKYHLYNGVSIVRRHRNYFEMFGFADSNHSEMSSTYITCLADLNNYADYFVTSGKDIIDQAIKHPLVLPPNLTVPYCNEICLGSNCSKFQINGFLGEAEFTSLEFFSLQLYLQGKTYKEIGKILDVSDKMVEKYLRNIKCKLGYHPKNIAFLQEIEGKLNAYPKSSCG